MGAGCTKVTGLSFVNAAGACKTGVCTLDVRMRDVADDQAREGFFDRCRRSLSSLAGAAAPKGANRP